MARRENAARQPRALDMTQQSEQKKNFALTATRAQDGKSGNTGGDALTPLYKGKSQSGRQSNFGGL